MKNYTNIEKHPLHKGDYLGYDSQGYAWWIGKSTSSSGSWCAVSKHYPNVYIFAFGLEKMSWKLAQYRA
jgi:hypothetical protein